MHVDRRSWAYAVLNETLVWGYEGIDRPDRRELDLSRRGKRAKIPLIAQVVCSDENYTRALFDQEVKYIVESEDYLDQWIDAVELRAHRKGRCPHGSPDEREVYEAVKTQLLEDVSEREEWARDLIEWDDIHREITDALCDVDGIMRFLKTHPVDAVWYTELGWVDLDNVEGYCRSCYRPLCRDDRASLEDYVRSFNVWLEGDHSFTQECAAILCDAAGQGCLFDKSNKLRRSYKCYCGWIAPVDGAFDTPLDAPFDWPPGAPFPPRRSFTGMPMEVAPFEEMDDDPPAHG